MQFAIKDFSEFIKVFRFLTEFYQPLMVRHHTFRPEHRSSSVFAHLGTCLLASILQAFLCIIYYEFLAKGIDETLGATRDDKLIWLDACKLYRIAYHITPQSTRGGYYHGVIFAHFNALKRYDFALINQSAVAVYCLCRSKLVEYIIVEHQHHTAISRVILYAEETLRGVVGLHIMHITLGDKLLILLTVRCKGYSSMEEHLKVRPYLLQMLLA